MPFPAWLASTVHVPNDVNVITPAPLTEHAGDDVEYDTANPLEALAAGTGAAAPNAVSANAGNVIVCAVRAVHWAYKVSLAVNG